MAYNLNTNPYDIIKTITTQWRWLYGLLIVLAIDYFVVYSLDINIDDVKVEDKILYKLGAAVVITIITSFVWIVSTSRLFQRTRYWVLLYLSFILSVGGLYFYVIYPEFIESTAYGTEIVRWGGACIISIFLFAVYYAIDFYCIKKKNLYIVFLVSNTSSNENLIKPYLDEARREIEETCGDIKIIIPPFGIVDGVRNCERYINRWFCQADAVIYAKMLESDEGFGFKFKDFTSRMNKHRLPRKREESVDLNVILTEASKCTDWNTLNSPENSIAKKEFIAENLVHLLLIYVGCIYMYKRLYSESIPVVNKLFDRISNGIDKNLSLITQDIIAHSYLTAEQWEEQEKRDYDKALETLEECSARLPNISMHIKYKLALARIYMLQGSIKKSKKVTKSIIPASKPGKNGKLVKDDKFDWYIIINMAFYAICERKPKEIYSQYKKLFKTPSPDIEELRFAINFQKYELKHTNDKQYKMMLYHGLAFLHLYLDNKQSSDYLKKAYLHSDEVGYEELENFRELIRNNTRKLSVRK